jgi:hypothetical protein
MTAVGVLESRVLESSRRNACTRQQHEAHGEAVHVAKRRWAGLGRCRSTYSNPPLHGPRQRSRLALVSSCENFNTSTLEFYKAIETTLSIKDAPVRPERIDYHESGVLSAKREYLRVSYARYSFDIGAAPFGKDFFFSWWMIRRVSDGSFMLGCLGVLAMPVVFAIFTHFAGWFLGGMLSLAALGDAVYWAGNAAGTGGQGVEDAILGLPLIGRLYARFIRPVTYYSEDTRRMFEETVHRIVLATSPGC